MLLSPPIFNCGLPHNPVSTSEDKPVFGPPLSPPATAQRKRSRYPSPNRRRRSVDPAKMSSARAASEALQGVMGSSAPADASTSSPQSPSARPPLPVIAGLPNTTQTMQRQSEQEHVLLQPMRLPSPDEDLTRCAIAGPSTPQVAGRPADVAAPATRPAQLTLDDFWGLEASRSHGLESPGEGETDQERRRRSKISRRLGILTAPGSSGSTRQFLSRRQPQPRTPRHQRNLTSGDTPNLELNSFTRQGDGKQPRDQWTRGDDQKLLEAVIAHTELSNGVLQEATRSMGPGFSPLSIARRWSELVDGGGIQVSSCIREVTRGALVRPA